MNKLLSVMFLLVFMGGGAVLAEVKKDTKAAPEEVIFEENFDDFEAEEETGFIPKEGKPPVVSIESKIVQGKRAMKIAAKEGVDYSTSYNALMVTKEVSYPNDNAKISFNYYAGPGINGLEIMTKDDTVNDNYGGSVAGLVKGKWTKVVMRVKTFKPKDPKSPPSPASGDSFRYLHIIATLVAGTEVKDQWVIIDDIKLALGSGK